MLTASKQTPPPQAHIQQFNTSLIRRREVERQTALSRSRLYALIAANDFPRPIRLGPMSVAWVEAEVQEWIASRITDSRKTFGSVQ